MENQLDVHLAPNLIDHDNTFGLRHINLSKNAINTNNAMNHPKRPYLTHSSLARKTDVS
jgi:hypothetical protein